MIRIKEACWYIVIGVAAALTHFSGLYIGVQCLQLSAAQSNIFGFFWAFWVSFLGHFFLTFRRCRPSLFEFAPFFKSMYRWLATSVGGFLLNQVLYLIGLQLVGVQFYLIVWLIVTLLVTILTFLSGKFWGFRHTES